MFGSIGCLAVASGIAAWRTGGLEAGIAMHAVNNVLVFVTVIVFGGFQEAFVDQQTTGTPGIFLSALVAHGIVLAIILWQAKRKGIDPYFRPPAEPEAAPAFPEESSWNPIPALNRPA